MTSLVESVNNLDSHIESINGTKDRLVAYITNRIQVDVESNTMELDVALDAFQRLANYGVQVAEVKRKVFNGKDLLKVDPLTKQERAMMDLLRMVNTPEKKSKLIDFINSMDDFETPKGKQEAE